MTDASNDYSSSNVSNSCLEAERDMKDGKIYHRAKLNPFFLSEVPPVQAHFVPYHTAKSMKLFKSPLRSVLYNRQPVEGQFDDAD